MSLGDIEELMFARGIVISYETIRSWSKKYGSLYAVGIKKRKDIEGDKWLNSYKLPCKLLLLNTHIALIST